MKLHSLITQYVTYRQSLGEKFITNGNVLKSFNRFLGRSKNLSDIKSKQVNSFLAGKGAITINWHKKHQALRGFYRYALSRGYVKSSPLPTIIPQKPQRLTPYIYNAKELKDLLDAALIYQGTRGKLVPYMVRTILLLLYGAGLRIGEVINISLADVDLTQSLLIIRETKFFKTRLVPIGTQLTQSLFLYVLWRKREGFSQDPQSPFFVRRDGKAIHYHNIDLAFRLIRKKAGVKRTDHPRYHPRLHDLRHAFAVHRLTTWYKEGADVQELLPVLSVYLGHSKLEDTSVYLTMTPALLDEAGHRFQTYAFSKENSHD